MANPIPPHRIARALGEDETPYLPAITAKRSFRSVWWAFTRGIGYGLARAIFRGARR